MLQQSLKGYWRWLLIGAMLPGIFLGQMDNPLQHRVPRYLVRYNQGGLSLGLLQWPENLQAVRYELEIFSQVPEELDPEQPVEGAVYRNGEIYTNRILLDEGKLPSLDDGLPLFWRVRAYDLDGNPISSYSQPKELQTTLVRELRDAPVPRSRTEGENGMALLYPVYSYTALPGAQQYEVEVLDQMPEQTEGILPSRHRVYAETTTLTDLYDKAPRIGTYYWRVRGMDGRGRPLGEWSLPEKVSLEPSGQVEVGIYGDSISHGGGHLSFSPADAAYSYAHYLTVPTVNLSESGDTSEMMVERFRRDVLPFRLKTLLIMGGSNSLRDGTDPDEVIADLKTLQALCRENGITPVLLTLAPINPGNIRKAFDEPTDRDWQESFRKVNAYIRTQPHIDVAAPFEAMGPELPTEMALDGLHGDVAMKQIMGQVINAHVKEFL